MIVLIGFMGAGKTAVGEILARRLDLPFHDTDALIEKRAGASVAEIFRTRGEPAFRALESTVVAEVLGGEDAVVALGGGALGDPATSRALDDRTVVHLFVDFDEAIRRVGADQTRPLLAGDPLALYGRRLGAYEVEADEVVQTDDLTPDQVADEILQRLHLATHAAAPTAVKASIPAEEHVTPWSTDANPSETGHVDVEAGPEISEPQEESPSWSAAAIYGSLATDDEVHEVEPVSAGPRPVSTTRIGVAAPSRLYEVVVGAGLLDRAAELAPVPPEAEKAFVVTHPTLLEFAGRAAKGFESAGLRTIFVEVPEGEIAKSLDAATFAYDLMADSRATRQDLVVGVGGGVVTDLAGFVASTFNRGMAVLQIPTTLLGQVDAAVGGKTGVNLPQAKNKVGTFHQPIGVVCDVETLQSLEPAELISGLAEVVKYGLIADGTLLDTVLNQSQELHARDQHVLAHVVSRSVAVKAQIVGADEKDEGKRAVLNYGHTIGHAIESTGDYRRYRHGEAIALGMLAAAYIAQDLWRTGEGLVTTHREALAASGLPIRAQIDPYEIEDALVHDKKYRGGTRFVLLRELGRPVTDVLVSPDVLRRGLDRIRA
jgi:shikimate kinase / 3-dehydroquinate synthase